MKKFWILCLLFSGVATAAPWQVASRLQTFYNGDRPLVTRISTPQTLKASCNRSVAGRYLQASLLCQTPRQQPDIFH